MTSNMLHLLKTKRFLPLFITQSLEAFNDNLFKNSLIILITYKLSLASGSIETLVAAAAGIFIFPFFIFSATAGLIADKYDKATLTRLIKIFEIVAMLFAMAGFITHQVVLLMFTLFLMGTHSAFFGPIKYAILPQHLKTDELIGGNALIEASTFIAILIGTILGGIIVPMPQGEVMSSTLGVIIAFAGLASSFFIPSAPSIQPDIKISYNLFKETYSIMKYAKQHDKVFLAILGISWFWFVGSAFLAQFPPYAKNVLNANAHVVTLFLTVFSIGIAIGSVLSERLQRGEISAKHVPASIFAMTIFILDLFFASSHDVISTSQSLIGVKAFLSGFQHWRILVDLLLISISGGLYIVPLYAFVQKFSAPSHRSRVIAANNILNALFMVVSALSLIAFAQMHFSIPTTFLTIGLLNALVAIYICKLLPFTVMQSLIAFLFKVLFKVKVHGIENFNQCSARTLIVVNHVSFIDALLVAAFLPEKVMFAINTHIAQKWWVKIFTMLVNVFPLDPTNPVSLKSLIKAIEHNQRCLIFPEGRITTTGALMKIYEGPAMIADKTQADILPIRIDGAQYSIFSRLRNKVRIRLFPTISITILPARKFAVDPALTNRERRQIIALQLYDLMTNLIFESSDYKKTLFKTLLEAKNIHGKKQVILEDTDRRPMSYQRFLVKSLVLGQYLKTQTKPQEYVGILLPNRIATAICFFALHAIVRIPAMLNFSMGSHAIKLACETAAIKVVLTSKQFIALGKLENIITILQEQNVKIIYLEDLVHKISRTNKLVGWLQLHLPVWLLLHSQKKISSSDSAVVLFTSGSEGTPKGVVLSHKNILANCLQMTSVIDFNARDIVFNAMPVFHSFGLTSGLLMPLLSGIKAFLYPSPLHYRIVAELIYDTNATIVFGTDTFLANYAKYANPYDFYSVRYVFAGAEKLKEETRKRWNEKFGVRIFEGYGATEASPVLTFNTPMQNKPSTVGRFLPKIQYRIETIPGIDIGGRLYVSGPNIMVGYLLHDNPLHIVPLENHWHDTGDIVSVDTTGFVTIHGRAKRFAKIGGEMVSLTAVETYINQLWPQTLNAVVAIPDSKKGEQLILVTENTNATREAFVEYFRSLGLSEINMPKQIVILDKLPLLGIGKINYVKLKEMMEEKFKSTTSTASET